MRNCILTWRWWRLRGSKTFAIRYRFHWSVHLSYSELCRVRQSEPDERWLEFNLFPIFSTPIQLSKVKLIRLLFEMKAQAYFISHLLLFSKTSLSRILQQSNFWIRASTRKYLNELCKILYYIWKMFHLFFCICKLINPLVFLIMFY